MKRPWLAPLVPLYAAGVALRDLRLRRGWETHATAALAGHQHRKSLNGRRGEDAVHDCAGEVAEQSGFHVDVLSRGYGRASSETARVRPEGTAESLAMSRC